MQVLGHICYHILAAGLNGYMATVTNLKNPVNKWRCGAAPMTVGSFLRSKLIKNYLTLVVCSWRCQWLFHDFKNKPYPHPFLSFLPIPIKKKFNIIFSPYFLLEVAFGAFWGPFTLIL